MLFFRVRLRKEKFLMFSMWISSINSIWELGGRVLNFRLWFFVRLFCFYFSFSGRVSVFISGMIFVLFFFRYSVILVLICSRIFDLIFFVSFAGGRSGMGGR